MLFYTCSICTVKPGPPMRSLRSKKAHLPSCPAASPLNTQTFRQGLELWVRPKVDLLQGHEWLPPHSLGREAKACRFAGWLEMAGMKQARTGVDNSHLTFSHLPPPVLRRLCLGDALLLRLQRGLHSAGVKAAQRHFLRE